jgi:hypothetical protein
VAREARLVETDTAFHVTARGNYRQTAFFSDEDRAEYLQLLGHHAALEGLEIFGWSLMTNHMHLLAVPGKVLLWREPCAAPSPTIRSVSIVGWVPAAVTSGSRASTRARWPVTLSGRFSGTSN